MSAEMQTKVQASPTQSFTYVQTGLLQKQSALCNTPGLVEDSGRDKDKLTLQRSSADQAGTTTVPRFGHDFSRVSVHSTGPGMIQTKLKINEPGDIYEQEADRVADQVMRMPEPRLSSLVGDSSLANSTYPHIGTIQRACASCSEAYKTTEQGLIQTKQITPLIQRQESLGEEEGEEELIQAKITGGITPEVTPAINSGIQSLQGGGQPLFGSERAFFEPRFGADFSDVRVHSDARAANVASLVNARAFTLGRNVVFGAREYFPDVLAGRKLLAHELAHVVQQGGKQNTIQTKYKLNELKKKKTPKVDSNPDTFFYKGSLANTKDKKALIIAGIHGREVSSCKLGKHVQSKLHSKDIKPDLHTVIVPCLVPNRKMGRGAGTGSQKVKDLNREFGGTTPSKNPLANKITQIVKEFNPDQTVSIHAISDSRLAGIYLDPKYSGKFPATGTSSQKKKVFTGKANNEESMRLTEDMITATRRSQGAVTTTKGNIAGYKQVVVNKKIRSVFFPRNKYPSKGTSPFNLLYPQQGQIKTKPRASLGVWMAGLGKTVITMELPGYKTPKSKWLHFVPALKRFMQLPGTRTYAPKVYTEKEKLNYLIGTLDLKKAGLDFGKKGQKIDLGKGTHKLGRALNLRESSFRCLEAMMKDAKAAGHDIIPFSGTRLFNKQKVIWENKFKFKSLSDDWGRLDPKVLKTKYPAECAGLKNTEIEWHSNIKKDKVRTALHKKCWNKLTPEEKAREILKTSSGPGFSRHHWGTEVDINSDKPEKWKTDKKYIALYKWLNKNAHKYGYYEAFNAGRPSGKGYTPEKWHWSFAPISVPLQKDYEKKILKSGTAGRTLLENKMNKVAGKDEALKLFKEYVETINPILRGNKKIGRPACMPSAAVAEVEETRCQQVEKFTKSICYNSERICKIAKELDDEKSRATCDKSQESCKKARERSTVCVKNESF